ncbi:MAG: hypothetical protein IJU40_07005, partial [Desulfovibrionaceae bacterium]|nr:hypothetical protein [Desulfovibrionaceae bacterium]
TPEQALWLFTKLAAKVICCSHMYRVASFIDDFNFYHSLRDANLNRFKWINYRSLSEAFITPSTEVLNDVFYFTALHRWDSEKVKRHKIFIVAFQTVNVHVIYGKFKRVEKNYRASCKQKYKTYEEKETDINIGFTML